AFLPFNKNNLSAVSGSTTRELAIATRRLLESRFSTRRKDEQAVLCSACNAVAGATPTQRRIASGQEMDCQSSNGSLVCNVKRRNCNDEQSAYFRGIPIDGFARG